MTDSDSPITCRYTTFRQPRGGRRRNSVFRYFPWYKNKSPFLSDQSDLCREDSSSFIVSNWPRVK